MVLRYNYVFKQPVNYSNIELNEIKNIKDENVRLNSIFISYLNGLYNSLNVLEMVSISGSLPSKLIQSIFKIILSNYDYNDIGKHFKTESILIGESLFKWPSPRIQQFDQFFFQDYLYSSPENYKGSLVGINEYSMVWTLGIILYQCLTGELPFPTYPAIVNFITSSSQNVEIPPQFYKPENSLLIQLITCCLFKNPNQRISWNEIVNHSFFRN
ncbi:hypothetical protein ACTFIV_010308 [Dictyostelium citrinum]